MKKKIIYLITCLLLCSTFLFGCGLEEEEENHQMTVLSGQKQEAGTITPAQPQEDEIISTSFTGRRGSTLSRSADGSVNIERITRSKTKAKSGTDELTVFVYMCGSDLESSNGLATEDIQEMLDSTKKSKNLKYVVCCGGSSYWCNDICNSRELTYLYIAGGSFEVVNTLKVTDMGDPNTLYNFLAEVLPKYSSDNNGLVFWNHGGGSITGVCFDENYNDNSLSLKEIDQALASTNDILGRNYDFIGFDACLMGSIEVANTLVPYADYMIGSEEVEVGEGWDYNAFAVNAISSTDSFYKGICDAFYKSSQTWGEDQTTLSVLKLSAVDDVIKAFDEAASVMFNNTNDYKTLGTMLKGIGKVVNFGGNNSAEGYTNMVDLLDLIATVSADNKSALETAINNCVLYKVNGKDHSKACGISVYYPLQIQGSSELKTFKNICVSPNYFLFVDNVGHGSMGEDVTSYEDSQVADLYWDNDDYSYDDSWNDFGNNNYHVNNDGNMVGEVDSIVQITNYGYMNDNDQFSINIAPSSLDYVDDVVMSLFWVINDNYAVYLGSDDDLNFDYDKGYATDNFDGLWMGLPDGQPLEYFLDYYTDNYEIMYSSPIQLNGKEMTLKFKFNGNTSAFEVIGAQKPQTESGKKDRTITKIKAGDVIVPLYDYYSLDEDYTDITYGDEYVVEDNFAPFFVELEPGQYLYNYEVIDIYGVSEYSDFVTFTIDDNGKIYYSFDNESYSDSNDMSGYEYDDGMYWWSEDDYYYAYDPEDDLFYMYNNEDIYYWDDRYEEWYSIYDYQEYDDYEYLWDYQGWDNYGWDDYSNGYDDWDDLSYDYDYDWDDYGYEWDDYYDEPFDDYNHSNYDPWITF